MAPVNALIVDDELIARKVARQMLESMDYGVVTAASGEDGLARFAEGDFDLVVTDINMPGMDGLELVRRITESDLEAACVIMTTRSDQDAAIEAMRCGAYGFLHKPFDEKLLREAVNKALRIRDRLALSRRLEGELAESRRDRRALESRFIDIEKLSALGQIAPRIAHEIKTPLQTISGHAELALHWLQVQGADAVDEVKEHLGVMLPAVTRIEALVQQMFELGRPVKPCITDVDVSYLLSRLLDELRSAGVTKRCTVKESYGCDLPTVRADAGQLEQVFQNLILNAVHAMEESDEKTLTVHVAAAPGQQLRIDVIDTGSGIEPHRLETIFQPFFTTKPEGKGTGLGLAIVKSVIERHGGVLQLHSVLGEGTRFSVSLPVSGAGSEQGGDPA